MIRKATIQTRMRLPVKSLVCNCRILVADLNNVTVLITPIQRWRADCVTAPRRSYVPYTRPQNTPVSSAADSNIVTGNAYSLCGLLEVGKLPRQLE